MPTLSRRATAPSTHRSRFLRAAAQARYLSVPSQSSSHSLQLGPGFQTPLSSVILPKNLSISSQDLFFHPTWLNDPSEQSLLLSLALRRLDETAGVGREARKYRREIGRGLHQEEVEKEKVKYIQERGGAALGKKENGLDEGGGVFLPPKAYEFEQGHFDGVIREYRETTVTSWTSTGSEENDKLLSNILRRLYDLFPTVSPSPSDPSSERIGMLLETPRHLLTHLLHLAEDGEILPHVDNVEASGGIILGLSLGSTRTLRITSKKRSSEIPEFQFDLELPPGSVYIQRNATRYTLEHSIPLLQSDREKRCQRLSIMIRDKLKP